MLRPRRLAHIGAISLAARRRSSYNRVPMNDPGLSPSFPIQLSTLHDVLALDLSGAHGPFFTRNLVVVTDSAGRIGIGEVPA